MRREVSFTDGKIIVRGHMVARGKRRQADYVLFLQKDLPLAVIEAKDFTYPLGGRMQQAFEYAEALDVPLVFSSNGEGFLFHDKTGLSEQTETTLRLEEFPSPAELWRRYRTYKKIPAAAEPVVTQPYPEDASGKEPRYYQRVAINRRRGHCQGSGSDPPGHGHRDKQDADRISDHLAAVEVWSQETHPVPCRS